MNDEKLKEIVKLLELVDDNIQKLESLIIIPKEEKPIIANGEETNAK